MVKKGNEPSPRNLLHKTCKEKRLINQLKKRKMIKKQYNNSSFFRWIRKTLIKESLTKGILTYTLN